ncbi:hypothetical protein AtDm6_0017 [Acetobacter tropicalis]|uniref:Uncharacterized protein n=1 Tax=Acetobacter tropicalis TaxID=104102 RepID=A0A095BCX9_9PROT|nr:hypothetical protein AtDm6_0017 [Acetobacter tropicalis]
MLCHTFSPLQSGGCAGLGRPAVYGLLRVCPTAYTGECPAGERGQFQKHSPAHLPCKDWVRTRACGAGKSWDASLFLDYKGCGVETFRSEGRYIWFHSIIKTPPQVPVA